MTLRVRAVSEEERKTLGQMARSRTLGAGLVRRAQIVLHALEGLKAPEIGARMDLGGVTVRHWLKRFNPDSPQGRRMRSTSDQRGHKAVVPGGGLALALEAGLQRTIGPGEVERDLAQQG
jgi:hypothetical protein